MRRHDKRRRPVEPEHPGASRLRAENVGMVDDVRLRWTRRLRRTRLRIVPAEAPVLGLAVDAAPVGRIDLDVHSIAPVHFPDVVAENPARVPREARTGERSVVLQPTIDEVRITHVDADAIVLAYREV